MRPPRLLFGLFSLAGLALCVYGLVSGDLLPVFVVGFVAFGAMTFMGRLDRLERTQFATMTLLEGGCILTHTGAWRLGGYVLTLGALLVMPVLFWLGHRQRRQRAATV